MWLVEVIGQVALDPSEPSAFHLIEGSYPIGRKSQGSASIAVSGDAVSRKHAQLVVGPADASGKQPLIIRDVGSKFGTAVNDKELPKETDTPMADGDVVTFGGKTVARQLRVRAVPLFFCLSALEKPQKERLAALAKQVGARLTSRWSDRVTHLVTSETLRATAKLVTALACCRPVVTLAWVEAVAARASPSQPLPNAENFAPSGGNATVPGQLAPKQERASFLANWVLLLVFPDAETEVMVKAAGAAVESLEGLSVEQAEQRCRAAVSAVSGSNRRVAVVEPGVEAHKKSPEAMNRSLGRLAAAREAGAHVVSKSALASAILSLRDLLEVESAALHESMAASQFSMSQSAGHDGVAAPRQPLRRAASAAGDKSPATPAKRKEISPEIAGASSVSRLPAVPAFAGSDAAAAEAPAPSIGRGGAAKRAAAAPLEASVEQGVEVEGGKPSKRQRAQATDDENVPAAAEVIVRATPEENGSGAGGGGGSSRDGAPRAKRAKAAAAAEEAPAQLDASLAERQTLPFLDNDEEIHPPEPALNGRGASSRPAVVSLSQQAGGGSSSLSSQMLPPPPLPAASGVADEWMLSRKGVAIAIARPKKRTAAAAAAASSQGGTNQSQSQSQAAQLSQAQPSQDANSNVPGDARQNTDTQPDPTQPVVEIRPLECSRQPRRSSPYSSLYYYAGALAANPRNTNAAGGPPDFKRFRKNHVIYGGRCAGSDFVPRQKMRAVLPAESERERQLVEEAKQLEMEETEAEEMFRTDGGGRGRGGGGASQRSGRGGGGASQRSGRGGGASSRGRGRAR